MIFLFWTKSLPNPKNVAIERAGTLKMEAGATQNGPPRRQNASWALQDEAQECQDGTSECPNGCPDGPWQPTVPLKVLPKVNSNVPRSLWDLQELLGAPRGL